MGWPGSDPRARRLATATVVAAVVLAGSAALEISAGWARLRSEDGVRNELFTRVSAAPLCVNFDLYYRSGFAKFREYVRGLQGLAPGIERLRIAGIDGHVLFDSRQLDSPELDQRGNSGPPSPSAIADPRLLEAVKGLDHVRLQSATGSEELVAPYLEDWGRHRLSVIYTLNAGRLRAGQARLAFLAVGRALLGLAAFALLLGALTPKREPAGTAL